MNATCLILGAGAAGLFCAATLGEGGCRDVAVLDGNDGPGKKLLLSGSGQCNFTHGGPVDSLLARYGGKDQERFLRKALHAFSNEDAKKFFAGRGLPPLVRDDGKVFPSSLRSSDVVNVLVRSAREGGVAFRFAEKAVSVSYEPSGGDSYPFGVRTAKDRYRSRFLVVATGGCSYPATGSDGTGYRIAEGFGHTVAAPHPALAPVTVRNYRLGGLAGVSLGDASLTLRKAGKKAVEVCGDLVFTHTGLSGPAVLRLSRSVDPGDVLTLRLTGNEDAEEFLRSFPERVRSSPSSAVKDFLRKTFDELHRDLPAVPKRLRAAVLEEAGLDGGERCGNLPKAAVLSLSRLIAAFPFTVEKTGGFAVAMATAGGVALSEVHSDSMESRILPGLFFAGEVLDVDGDSGGYNIQAAFSTAHCAARAILDRIS